MACTEDPFLSRDERLRSRVKFLKKSRDLGHRLDSRLDGIFYLDENDFQFHK
jgi:hypothetical protein